MCPPRREYSAVDEYSPSSPFFPHVCDKRIVTINDTDLTPGFGMKKVKSIAGNDRMMVLGISSVPTATMMIGIKT